MAFFNNSKIVEAMENVHKTDLKVIEKVKAMLLNKVINLINYKYNFILYYLLIFILITLL